MTVAELIAALEGFPPDAPVVLSDSYVEHTIGKIELKPIEELGVVYRGDGSVCEEDEVTFPPGTAVVYL